MAVEASRGVVFGHVVRGVLALAAVFLTLEIYQLRVAVENSGLGGYEARQAGNRQLAGLVASIAEPLQAIARRLDRMSDVVAEPVIVTGGVHGKVPAAGGDDAPGRTAVTANHAPRQEISPQFQTQLASLVTAIQNIEKRPKVTGASIPKRGDARPADLSAVRKSIARLRADSSLNSRFLLLDAETLLARYGKPGWMGINEDGSVYWTYAATGEERLSFKLYDGRVISVDPY